MNLTLNIPAPLWLSANRPITNHAHRARIVRDLHFLTGAALRHAIQWSGAPAHVTPPVHLAWTIHYPKGTSRKADPPNSYPTVKACLDAIVRATVSRHTTGAGDEAALLRALGLEEE